MEYVIEWFVTEPENEGAVEEIGLKWDEEG